MTKKFKQVFILSTALMSLNLIPLMAMGADATKIDYHSLPDDLTPSDFTKYFQGEVKVKSADEDNSQLFVTGQVFDDCRESFTVTAMEQVASSNYGKVAFKISDPSGEGRKCLDQKHQGQVCNNFHRCTDLSSLQSERPYRVRNTEQGYFVGFSAKTVAHLDADSDINGLQFFKGDLSHNSAREKQKVIDDAALALANAKQAAIEADYAKACAAGDVTAATADAKKLGASQDQVKQIISSLNQGDLDLITKCIKTKSEDLDSCLAKLDTFAAAHADDAKLMGTVANDYILAANRAAAGKKTSDYQAAMDIVDNASDVSGISDSRLDDLAALKKEFKLSKLQAEADGGKWSKPLQADYKDELKELQQAVKAACGRDGDPSDCQQAMQDYQSIAQGIPQEVQQSAYQQQQLQAQMAQALQGIGQPSFGAGAGVGSPTRAMGNQLPMGMGQPQFGTAANSMSNPMSRAGSSGMGQFGQVH